MERADADTKVLVRRNAGELLPKAIAIMLGPSSNYKSCVEHKVPVQVRTEEDERASSELTELAIAWLAATDVRDRVSPYKRVSVLGRSSIGSSRWVAERVWFAQEARPRWERLELADQFRLAFPFAPEGDVTLTIGTVDGCAEGGGG